MAQQSNRPCGPSLMPRSIAVALVLCGAVCAAGVRSNLSLSGNSTNAERTPGELALPTIAVSDDLWNPNRFDRSESTARLLAQNTETTPGSNQPQTQVTPQPDETQQRVVEMIDARLERLQSLVVEYERIDIYMPIPEATDSAALSERLSKLAGTPGKIEVRKGTEAYACRFKYLNGMKRFDRDLTKALNQHPVKTAIYSYLPDRFERFWEQPPGTNHGDRQASVKGVSPDNFTIDVALGLRFYGEWTPLTREQLEACEFERTDENVVVMSTDRTRGNPDFRVIHELTFDRRKGFALAAYRRLVKDDDATQVATEMVMENFREYDGVVLPELISHRTPNYEYGRVVRSTLIRVDDYRIDDPANTAESYPIDFPERTMFTKHRETLRDFIDLD